MDEGHSRFHPFDPDSGLVPQVAEFGPLAERSEGCGILFIAVPDVETPLWCAKAAAALATTWSAQGARIVLADVSLAEPILHEVFDLPNSEGVADLIMKGAQLRAVCQQTGSRGLLFMSAGTPTGDVADVASSDRWDVVLKALDDADVTLVTFAPADLLGLEALRSRSNAVLLLGGDMKGGEEAIKTLGLGEAPQIGPAARSPGSEPTKRAAVAGVAAAAGMAGVAEGPNTGDTPPSHELGAPAVRPKRSLRVPHWKLGTAVGLLVLAVWAGSRVLFGGGTGSLEVLEERAEPPVPVVAPPPETPQAYSLSLAAFEDASVAARRAENLTGRRADLLFTTVPVLVSGRVFHRILAGPAMDSAAAEELRRSLGESLSGEDTSVWIVRATPLAFALGDYESREEADRRAEEVAVASLAPYVFEIGVTDRPSFRVYAGAYADSAEASVAHAGLMEAGEELPQLVRRVGRYVARP